MVCTLCRMCKCWNKRNRRVGAYQSSSVSIVPNCLQRKRYLRSDRKVSNNKWWEFTLPPLAATGSSHIWTELNARFHPIGEFSLMLHIGLQPLKCALSPNVVANRSIREATTKSACTVDMQSVAQGCSYGRGRHWEHCSFKQVMRL